MWHHVVDGWVYYTVKDPPDGAGGTWRLYRVGSPQKLFDVPVCHSYLREPGDNAWIAVCKGSSESDIVRIDASGNVHILAPDMVGSCDTPALRGRTLLWGDDDYEGIAQVRTFDLDTGEARAARMHPDDHVLGYDDSYVYYGMEGGVSRTPLP